MAFLKLVLAMFLSFLPGIVGLAVAPISSGGNLWYNTLVQPALTPDGWVFSVAWVILYFLIGLALFFIMQTRTGTNHDKVNAYSLFIVNIVLNALWSFVFFGAFFPEAALIVLTALIVIAVFMARAFYKVNKTAFWLTIPYVLWLIFAFYLNSMIIYLN